MISILYEIKKRGHSRWYLWSELFNDYYMLMKDENGNNDYRNLG